MSNENQVPPVWTLLGGDGSRDQPYVIGPTSFLSSTVMQMKIIEDAYGAGEYSPDSRQRRYHESPRGAPGNKDLCEHILLKSGRSVWFDLCEVTKYQESHPNAVEESMRLLGAKQAEVDQAKQYIATGGRSGMQPKRTGCLGLAVVVVVVMLIAAALVVVRAVASAGRL